MNWFDHMKAAYELASSSPDPSTQNSALILDDQFKVVSTGINRFPNFVEMTEDRWQRPAKYDFVCHAERNAIYDAAKRGIKTANALMVSPWAACTDCARGIIQSGIKILVTHQEAHDRTPDHWKDSVKTAMRILEEGKVQVVFWSGVINSRTIRFNGEKWTP